MTRNCLPSNKALERTGAQRGPGLAAAQLVADRSTRSLSMRRNSALIAGFILAACVVDHSYSPGDDPLLRKVFEQLLAADRISYTMDAAGRYRVPSSDWDKMVKRGEQAIAQTVRTVDLFGKGPCPDDKLRVYLRATPITFVEVNEGGRTRFRATAEDSARVKMMERLASFEFECEDEQKVKKPHA